MMRKYLMVFCLLQTLAFGAEMESPNSFTFNEEQVEAYHNSTSNQLEGILKILESQFFVNAERVLDLGCGDGQITALLAKKFPAISIIGCDVSKSMIEFASKQYTSLEYPNLHFVERDAMNLGFHNQFDRVIAFNCLHWTKNQLKVMHEIFASLKPGGEALIIVVPKCAQDDLQSICAKLMTSSKWSPFFKNHQQIHSFHTEEEYQIISAEEHLLIGKIQQSIRDVLFDDWQSLKTLLTAVLTPLYTIPEDYRAEFLQDLFELLREKGRIDVSGKIHLHIAQLELLVIKPLLPK